MRGATSPGGILRFVGVPLCGFLVALVIGCGAKARPASPGPEELRARQQAPAAAAKKPKVPRADQLGPAMDLKKWKIQCSNEDLAMMCRKSDPTDRRCACKHKGQYRWTYGSYCKRVLPCGKKACR